MADKVVLVLCAQALLTQCVLSQCIGRGLWPGPAFPFDGLPYDGLGFGRFGTPFDYTATMGGAFPMSSLSCSAPVGLSIISDNTFEGSLYVVGEMPFISSVSLEGVLPSSGAGAINYACGNGITAMVSDGIGPGFGPPVFGLGTDNFGYRIGCGN